MSDGSGSFQLSASLPGHEKDVRAVCFPTPEYVFTASRDCTVQSWSRVEDSPPTFAPTLLIQGSYFFNSLAFLPPSESRPQYPKGLVLSGSQDQTIDVRRPDSDLTADRVALLSGHSGNVSSLSVSPNGEFVVSGDWDGKAKMWSTSTWELLHELVGPDAGDKQRALWSVLAYSNTIVVTGSADHVIRGYTLQNVQADGKELHPGVTIRTGDVVRALCRVRNNHPSGAKIASAGNDFNIRLWQFNGAEVGLLRGHESYIYSIDSLPTGELVSSSEDRTVRVWRGTSCVQTITHPALSIWSVSVCQKTGDFATGASDHVARVFTRSADRLAAPAVQQEFEQAVQHSAIPKQQVGDINPSTLPGPDFIETKSGTKEGQTVMINGGDGSVKVYQWSMAQSQWLLVGNLASSAEEQEEEASIPPATQSAEPQITPADTNPFGPGAAFITIATGNFAPILKRIKTVNGDLAEPQALSTSQVSELDVLSFALQRGVTSVPKTIPAVLPPPVETFKLEKGPIVAAFAVATTWPYKDRLPGLDLLRCAAVSPSLASFSDSAGHSVLEAVLTAVTDFAKDTTEVKTVENNSMMALRLIANLFATEAGQKLVAEHATKTIDFVAGVLDFSERKNRNLMTAWVTAVNNITAFGLREQEQFGKSSIGQENLARLIKILAAPILDLADEEVVYRSLVALGNLASIPGEGGFAQRVRAANARTWISLAIGKLGEERVKRVGEKILGLLE